MKISSNKNDMDSMCDVDEHNLIHGKCRICSICHESSRFKLSAAMPNPSNNISNDELGEASCSKCGACSNCMSSQESESVPGK